MILLRILFVKMDATEDVYFLSLFLKVLSKLKIQ